MTTDEPTQAVRTLARMSRLLERASPELNLAHYRVLSAVAEGDRRASRMAERLAVGKPAVSSAVDALCQRGLLTRDDVHEDQRAAALSITEEGAAVLKRAESAMIARLTGLAERTGDAATVVRSLSALGGAIDQAVEERRAR